MTETKKKKAFRIKSKAFFMIFKGLSMKQITQFFLEGERSTLVTFHKGLVSSLCLTILRVQGVGGVKKAPPNRFSSVTSANIGISLQNFLTFSFNPFATLV